MAIGIHHLEADTFDRKAGRWLLPGVLLVVDSDLEPTVGDLVRTADGELRVVADSTDWETVGNGARVIGVMVPR